MSLKLGLFMALLLVAIEPPTEAHDIYSPLRDKAGRKCCDDGDCRPAPYRVRPTGVQMFVEGEWIWVPDATIQYRALPGDTGETDGGHWCGRVQNGRGYELGYVTFCAILPPNPTAISGPSVALRKGGYLRYEGFNPEYGVLELTKKFDRFSLQFLFNAYVVRLQK